MGGPRSRVCARLNLCSAPNDTSGNLIAHMFGSGGKKKRSILSPCQATINILFFCFLGENFCYLQPHLKLSARFHNPKTTPSGRKACGREKKNNPENCGHFVPRTYSSRTNNTKYSGHFVLLQCPRAGHALQSNQFLLMPIGVPAPVSAHARHSCSASHQHETLHSKNKIWG